MAFLRTKRLCSFFFFFFFMVLLTSSTLFTISHARRFEVGGSGAWVPNPSENYGSWAGKSRFRVHDTLYFSYAKGADSVLEVNKADYDGCHTKNPIKKLDDGNSEISLDRSGPFYFISGNEDSCKKGQKLTVVVLSVRTPPPQAATPGNSPPESMPPKSSSPVSPSSAPVTSPPAPQPPKSSSPSSDPGTSTPGSMAPKSSSALSPSSAPGESPSSVSSSPSANSPPEMGPSADAPSGSAMGPSGDGPSTSSDITTPTEAPGEKKSSTNGMAVMSVTTVSSLVLTIFMSA